MKYMLMMNTMKLGGDPFPSWSKDDIRTHIRFMVDIDKELRAKHELVSDEGLAFPDQAKLVRADQNGQPITDGVFPESKEFLAGFWIVDVPTPERAYEIAAQISAAPGPGGRPVRMPIEVRQVMSAGCEQEGKL